MSQPLTLKDIDASVRSKIYTQQYGNKPTIDGVQTFLLKHHVSEDSDFVEILRLTADGHLKDMPTFQVRQISRSLQYPGAIKAWHLHFVQDELWYVPSESHLFVGLWDLRKDSPTRGTVVRMVMGKAGPSLLYIPCGVAHGSANLSTQNVTIIYCASEQFNKEKPDELRLAWDIQGKEFWQPQRD